MRGKARTKFSDRLKGLRLDKGITVDEAADAIGIERSTLSVYENGHALPGRETVQAIANYYERSLDWLLTGQGDPNPTALQDRTAEVARRFDSLSPSDKVMVENLIGHLEGRR
jgi:transcriptional regulator with XRE-family HTH domain